MGIEIYFTGELKNAVEQMLRKAGPDSRPEEIRLRINRPIRVLASGNTCYLAGDGSLVQNEKEGILCRREEMERSLELMSDYSLYAFHEEIKNGFLTLPGGHRVGLCGQAVCDQNGIRALKNISSMNLRLAGEHVGIAGELSGYLFRENGSFLSTLILSPAGCGKTTLLRDIVRNVSDRGLNVSVIDERSEIAACYKGVPQNDVGSCTDVLDQAPKAKGILMVLRAMSPRVIAVDEINDTEDMQAIRAARACGAALLCTMHSDRNGMEQPIVSEGIFERYIQILDKRKYRLYGKGGTPLKEGLLTTSEN